jgi:hypothetical protein
MSGEHDMLVKYPTSTVKKISQVLYENRKVLVGRALSVDPLLYMRSSHHTIRL